MSNWDDFDYYEEEFIVDDEAFEYEEGYWAFDMFDDDDEDDDEGEELEYA